MPWKQRHPPLPPQSPPPNLKLPLPLDNLPVLHIQPYDVRPPRSAVDVLEEVGERGFLALGFAFDLYATRPPCQFRSGLVGGGGGALLFGVLRTQPVIP